MDANLKNTKNEHQVDDSKLLLKDPNVERYVADAIKPLQRQIATLKGEIKQLERDLHEIFREIRKDIREIEREQRHRSY